MIVKKHGNIQVSPGTLYAFGGAAFGALTIGLMVSSHFAVETYPGCSERYVHASMLPLENGSGTLVGPAQLQSRLGGNEWGVLDNIEIKPETTPLGKVAMTVKFDKGGSADRVARRASSGVGFNWQPGYLRKASAACLSYSVRVPAAFDFGHGGVLPGLFGARPPTAESAETPFSIRMRWLEGSKLGLQIITPQKRGGDLVKLSDTWLRMPVGQWVAIEQEVVLNTPGRDDGALRVWIDGRLHLNVTGIAFRQDASTFAGVVADTHYANRSMDWAPAPKATSIQLTPPIVRWN